MLQALKEWVFKKLLGNVVTGDFIVKLIKAIGDGKFGAAPKAAYWFLAGKKRWIAIGVAAIYTVLLYIDPTVCPKCPEYASIVYGAAGILLAAGLFDAAVRIEPPTK